MDALAVVGTILGIVFALWFLRAVVRFIRFHASEEPPKGRAYTSYWCEWCYTFYKPPNVPVRCTNPRCAGGPIHSADCFDYD
jgi:hypothetical protein